VVKARVPSGRNAVERGRGPRTIVPITFSALTSTIETLPSSSEVT